MLRSNLPAIIPDFSKKLLVWYDKHARAMPWRVPPKLSKKGERPDPYHTWLSEIMLQQTQVATVGSYFEKFLQKWPTIIDLANADEDDVMKAWAGLGYYSRARNLKKCAQILVDQHRGQFPTSVHTLKKLPGIGDYTACAIASIAFGNAEPVVDGNVERVVSRLFRLNDPMPKAKDKVRQITNGLLCEKRPGDFAQAMMDLGATICTPRNPRCQGCPIRASCQAFAKGDAENFPVKIAKTPKPTRKGAAFVIVDEGGRVFLRKRQQKGLLAGMSEVPSSEWNARQDGKLGETSAPIQSDWIACEPVKHTFTHFHLELEVWRTHQNEFKLDGWWVEHTQLQDEALPTVMRKVIQSALNQV